MKIALHAMPGHGASAFSSTACPSTMNWMPCSTRSRQSPEELAPAELAHHPDQLFVCAAHDGAAFVEDRQHVPDAPAPALLGRNVLRVQGVDRRFRARKGEPRERVEEVVPVLLARRDAAGLVQWIS
jgi:hypothetical protein